MRPASPTTVYLGGAERPPGLELLRSGKVRDVYELDARLLLFVTTDRVSAFDVVMREGVPHKGAVLTAIAAHWFERTKDIVPNHLVHADVERVPGLDARWRERLRGRVLVVRRAEPSPIEWVVRGYLAGSGWKEYQRSGTVCGIALPEGLALASRLPAPLLTPTTKSGEKDLPLSPAEARALVGAESYAELERLSLALFARGTEELAQKGFLLADTKFEFGRSAGRWILIDEALTPDSSRFWPAESWQPGHSPASWDKQILRDYLETLAWDKRPPAPELDPAVLRRLSERYLDVCERITGRLPIGARG
jgi:phosphoribosylaminoimidazole-succinocarboxamide synthase